MIAKTKVTEYSFKEYEGMTPEEIMNTYIVGVGSRDYTPVTERQTIIIFLKMVLGDTLDNWQKAQMYKGLGKFAFQRNFCLVVGSLILVLQHVEAYELLVQVQQTINDVSQHKSLRELNFWYSLPIKPDYLANTTK